jgi:endonuclease-3
VGGRHRTQIGGSAKSPSTVRRILATLQEQHPNASTELTFANAFELLVATILSAQCADARVNAVTPALFARYPDARALASARRDTIESLIRSTGFFRSKAKSLQAMASVLMNRHHGAVPADMADLVKLPGVGRKTANVVLGHAMGVAGFPVDRHVLRVANRLGLALGSDPVAVEHQLCTALPEASWVVASDTLILHGRRVCKPRPLCDDCATRKTCPSRI